MDHIMGQVSNMEVKAGILRPVQHTQTYQESLQTKDKKTSVYFVTQVLT